MQRFIPLHWLCSDLPKQVYNYRIRSKHLSFEAIRAGVKNTIKGDFRFLDESLEQRRIFKALS